MPDEVSATRLYAAAVTGVAGGPVDNQSRSGADVQDGIPGPLGDRILAHVIDALIVFVPLFVLWVIALRFLPFIIGTVISNGLSLAYFVFMEAFWGQTIGKRFRRLHVRNEAGTYPTMEQALRRNLYLVLGIIPGLIGSFLSLGAIIWIAVTIGTDSAHRQGVHDKFANATFVFQTPRL